MSVAVLSSQNHVLKIWGVSPTFGAYAPTPSYIRLLSVIATSFEGINGV